MTAAVQPNSWWLGLALLALLQLGNAAGAASGSAEHDKAALLQFRDGITNWPGFALVNGVKGWDDSTPLCTWSYVSCSAGRVTQLMVDGTGTSMSLHGQLGPALAEMDALLQLSLTNAQLHGPLPDAWGQPGSFKSLAMLALSNNALTGTLPPSWGSKTVFKQLIILDLGMNGLQGPIPATWGGVNTFSKLQTLVLAQNALNGTLPSSLPGANLLGPTVVPTLRRLALYDNLFTGALPSGWGRFIATDQMEFLDISNNFLTGPIPNSWTARVSFPTATIIKPGNAGLCGNSSMYLQLYDCSMQDPSQFRLRNATLQPCSPLTGSPTLGRPCAAVGQATAVLLLLDIFGDSVAPFDQARATALQSAVFQAVRSSAPKVVLIQVAQPTSNATVLPGAAARVRAVLEVQFGFSGAGMVTAVAELQAAAAGGALQAALAQAGIPAEQVVFVSADEVAPMSVPMPAGHLVANPGGGGTIPIPSAHSSFTLTAKLVTALLVVAGALLALWLGRWAWLHYSSRRGGDVQGQRLNVRYASIGSNFMSSLGFGGFRAAGSMEEEGASSRAPGQANGGPHSGGSRADSDKLSDGSHTPRASRAGSIMSAISGLHSRMNSLGSHLGMWSDWEINADELEILKRDDGTDWVLGAGAYGQVFKATRNHVHVVAVKVFNMDLGSAGVEQEVAILKSCRDKNIVQFLGACVSEKATMLVTEFMENGDLRHALNHDPQRRFSWGSRKTPSGKLVAGLGRRCALDIARGLHFLHNSKIVHMDLKSPNILLARDYTAKIADVGLAKILHQQYLTTMHNVQGTFAWTAPEVLMGQRCTEKVDIFSFGVVLWELVTAESPVRGHMRPPRVPEECPEVIAELLEKCLETDPEKRPSAANIVHTLLHLQSPGSSGPAALVPADSESPTTAQRVAAVTAAASAVVGAAVGAVVAAVTGESAAAAGVNGGSHGEAGASAQGEAADDADAHTSFAELRKRLRAAVKAASGDMEEEISEVDSEMGSEAPLLNAGDPTSSRPSSLHSTSPATAARVTRGMSISPNSSGGSESILGRSSVGTMAPINEGVDEPPEEQRDVEIGK